MLFAFVPYNARIWYIVQYVRMQIGNSCSFPIFACFCLPVQYINSKQSIALSMVQQKHSRVPFYYCVATYKSFLLNYTHI